MSAEDGTIFIAGQATATGISIPDRAGAEASLTVDYRVGTLSGTKKFPTHRMCPILNKNKATPLPSDTLVVDGTETTLNIARSMNTVMISSLMSKCGQCILYEQMNLGGNCKGFRARIDRTRPLTPVTPPDNEPDPAA